MEIQASGSSVCRPDRESRNFQKIDVKSGTVDITRSLYSVSWGGCCFIIGEFSDGPQVVRSVVTSLETVEQAPGTLRARTVVEGKDPPSSAAFSCEVA